MALVSNPPQPWVAKALKENWAALLAEVPSPTWLPVADGRTFRDYGCGHYGCVMPTTEPGMVCKITSDESEVEFIRAAMKIGDWPTGIVRYTAAMDLPTTHRSRKVYAIWREEAFDVGQGKLDRTHYAFREFSKYHEVYRSVAGVLRPMVEGSKNRSRLLVEAGGLKDWAWRNVVIEDGSAGYDAANWWSGRNLPAPFLRYRGAQRLAAGLRICEIAFELMANTAYGTEVGAALGFYLEHGILLADVHTNNLGHVDRDDYSQRVLAITDPGHAVFLTPR